MVLVSEVSEVAASTPHRYSKCLWELMAGAAEGSTSEAWTLECSEVAPAEAAEAEAWAEWAAWADSQVDSSLCPGASLEARVDPVEDVVVVRAHSTASSVCE